MFVYARDRERNKYYRLILNLRQVKRLDNGSLRSTGLTVGENIAHSTIQRYLRDGIAREVTEEKYRHSGCQSSCVLRGDPKCGW